MKRLTLIAAASFVIGLVACTQMPVSEKDMGLSKTSAFDTPTPKAYTLDGTGAGGSATTAYGAPPLVKHSVDAYLPITRDKNMCLSCHDNPGAPKVAGQATTMPPSHYAQGKVSGARYNCELCHAPAANVPDLVGNDAPKPKS